MPFHRFLIRKIRVSMKEFFSNKVTVSRPANNTEFLQRNFSEVKFKVSYGLR